MNTSVIVADDENLIRNLFTSSLGKYEDITIVGQAANGEEVMKMLKSTQPDVLLLDLNMPRLSGIDVLKLISAESIHVNTLVISMQDNDELIRESLSAGALGYLFKSEEWDEMYTAIKTVAKGKFYNTNRINSILLEMIHEHKHNGTSTPQKNKEFNERELTIIRYLNDGLSSSEIAEKIYCSRATVDRIRQELIHRVGAKNTAGLISHAMRHKLIELNKI